MGFYILLILSISAPVVAVLFFADARGVPYGWFIGGLWILITLATSLFGIFYYGQFVLPAHKGENWWEGVAMILRASTHAEKSAQAASLKAVAPAFPGEDLLPPSFKTLQAGMLPSHLVLAVSKGDSFSRPAGPGFVKLQPGERITQVIDLRRHWRSQELEVNTRDGIPLQTRIDVGFQVKESTTGASGIGLPYPYDTNAVFLVSQLSSIDGDNQVLPWSEQIAPQAAAYMVSEFALFMLDAFTHSPSIFSSIEQSVKGDLEKTFNPFGITIHDVNVMASDLPEQVVSQRLATWRAPLQSRMRIRTIAANEEAAKQFKLAHARTQIEIIEKIMNSIHEIRQIEQANLADIVASQVVDVLEETSTKSSVQLMQSQIFNSRAGQSQRENPTEGSAANRTGGSGSE